MRVLASTQLLLLLIALLLSGCNPTHIATLKTSVFSPAYWSGSGGEQQVKKIRAKVEQALADNDLTQARQVLIDSRHKPNNEKNLADLYTKVGNRLLNEAELAETTGHPDRAGELFRMTLEIYPFDPQLQTTFILTNQEIDRHIEQCADSLMKEGLVAYRSGELVNAISIWQGISRFHPEHRASRVAIETAEQQLRNLELLAVKDAI